MAILPRTWVIACMADGKKVGIVTCGMYSTLTKRSMAIARLDVR